MTVPTPTISQAMIDLYDRFTHGGGVDRRTLMTGLARLAGGSAAATAALTLIEARADAASLTSAADPRITTERLLYSVGGTRTLVGYLAKPVQRAERAPTVLVVHENRGLNEHIRDVTRRLAISGFVALAPDFLTPLGETPRRGDGTNSADDIARALIAQLDRGAAVGDAVASLAFLENYEMGRGKPGALGFCWGGGLVNQLAIAAGAKLRAGVVYYGPAPADLSDVARVKAPMMFHFAGLDGRVNASAQPWLDALRAAGVKLTVYGYPDVNHAFNNDTSAARYNKAAANTAWARTLDFLR